MEENASRLDSLKKVVLDQLQVEKDYGFEVEIRAGFLSFWELLQHQKGQKLKLIEELQRRAEEMPLEKQAPTLSLLHEAYWDVTNGVI